MMIIFGGLGLEEDADSDNNEENKDAESKKSQSEDPPTLNDFYVLTGL